MELRGGTALGISVKGHIQPGAAESLRPGSAQGSVGADLLGGVVLYTGTRTFSMGEGIWAVPVPAIWQL